MPIAFSAKQATSGKKFANNYFEGSIIAYGNFGVTTQFDRVYPVFEDMDSIYEVDGCAEFMDTAKKYVAVGAPLNVTDFVEELKTDDVLGYVRASDANYVSLFEEVGEKCVIRTGNTAS